MPLRGYNSMSVEANSPVIRRQLGRICLEFADNSIDCVLVTDPDFRAFCPFTPKQ